MTHEGPRPRRRSPSVSRFTPPGLTERLRAVGDEPDPGFTLANERTFLAWIRTALAITAAGVALESLLPAVPMRAALAAILVGLGVLVSASAFRRWMRIERALRLRRLLPAPRYAPVLAYGLAALSVVRLLVVPVNRT